MSDVPPIPKLSAEAVQLATERLRKATPRRREPKTVVSPIPRVAVTQQEACAALSCSEEFFVEHFRPHMRAIRRGRKRLFPISELERVVDELAENIL